MHKGGQINNVQLITGVRIAEMSQLHVQNCSVMCTKKGGYCENEKNERKSQGRGSWGCVQRTEVIVKRKKKSWGGCHSRCKWRIEAFVKLKKKTRRGGGGGGGGQVGGGDVRVDVNGEVTLF